MTIRVAAVADGDCLLRLNGAMRGDEEGYGWERMRRGGEFGFRGIEGERDGEGRGLNGKRWGGEGKGWV